MPKTGKSKKSKQLKKVRIAMVGAGNMANNVHYPSLASFGDVEIAAVCDIDTKRLNDTADKYDVEKRYTDYREMVEEISPHGVYGVSDGFEYGEPPQV